MTNNKICKTTVAVSIHYSNVNPIYGDGVTTVSIQDEGGGFFFCLDQSGSEREGTGKVFLDIEELEGILQAVKEMKKSEPEK